MAQQGNPHWLAGNSGNPSGRKKGTPNKVTGDIRTAYQNLIEMNLDNMTAWLQSIAAEDPHKAMDTLIKLSDFIIRKLARQEVTGADGEDLFKSVRFEFGPDVNDKENRETGEDSE